MKKAKGADKALLLAVLPLLWWGALGATWHVSYDPGQPEDRVGATAAQAASGDTILIDAGTYYEHIPLEGKSLTLIGSGIGQTILDGSRALSGREGGIIYTLTGARADLSVQGMTFRNGTGSRLAQENNQLCGGAILWWTPIPTEGGILTVADCAFQDNTTGQYPARALSGGAIYALDLTGLTVTRTTFSGNTAMYAGGDIWTSCYGPCEIGGCTFAVSPTGAQQGVSLYIQFGDVLIADCLFEAVSGNPYALSISGEQPSRVEIADSRFIDRSGALATRMQLASQSIGFPRQDVLLHGNLFWNQAGQDSANPATVTIGMQNGGFDISGNTFVRCGTDIQNEGGGPPIVFRNNILIRGAAHFFIPSGGSVSCNDFWKSVVTGVNGSLPLTDDIRSDPLFCGEATGDFTLARQSPCAEANAPAGCGRIGAFPEACDLTPTLRTTWGRIRQSFR